MDKLTSQFNVTYITLVGHVELLKYRHLYFVIMFIVYTLILLCNFTIICLIMTHRSLREPMYIFIAALLLNSVLFSTVVYPKLLIDFLSDKQVISFSLCALQSLFFYSLEGSEFLLLAVMAFDRYVSICKPLQYPTIMRKTTVSILLILAWLVPACHLLPSFFWVFSLKLCRFTLKGIFCNNAMSRLYCQRPQITYALYGAFIILNTTFMPFLFILFTYTRIVIVLYKSCKEVRMKAVQTCLPHLLVLISFSCLCSYDIIIARLKAGLPTTVHFVMTLQVILYHPLFNPVIYGLKMKEISKHLMKLLRIKTT
uniref:Olfactory receptor n=1 Tax=Salarias fasciatus TaxID=181472 RepID=A0A672GUA2_SALFA